MPEPPLNEYIGFRAIYDVTYEHTGAADKSQYNVSTFLYSNPWVTQERQNRGYLKQDLANSFDFHAPLGGAKFWVESNGDVELRGIPGGIEYSIQHLNTNKNIPAYNSDTESWNYNIASFADVRIELFNPVMTEKEGFIGDSGEWHRPNFDYYTGEDKGRTEQTVPYTSLEFTVNASGVYGFKTANKLPSGGMTVRSVLYVFDGKPKEVGDYDNLLAEHSQGHIAGVYLEKGKTYYLVNSDDFASSDAQFLLFVGGPDNIVFK
ncbi:hypothetical protein JCM19232_4277 [Vibrio ishigakensis]|uniref:Uncharacterized protein n=1 Tax=Vibrio ishigakensis TaxID=1481914 RepID=A0A0B8PKT6_9VIBR|nr:hypothetical protein JCM19232_4277 [Vibrio ishigakensis]